MLLLCMRISQAWDAGVCQVALTCFQMSPSVNQVWIGCERLGLMLAKQGHFCLQEGSDWQADYQHHLPIQPPAWCSESPGGRGASECPHSYQGMYICRHIAFGTSKNCLLVHCGAHLHCKVQLHPICPLINGMETSLCLLSTRLAMVNA